MIQLMVTCLKLLGRWETEKADENENWLLMKNFI